MALPRAIDYAHSTAAELLQNFVVSQTPPLIDYGYFFQNAVELVRRMLAISACGFTNFEETPDTKAIGKPRRATATRASFRLFHHARERVGQPEGRGLHFYSIPAANTEQRCRISPSISD